MVNFRRLVALLSRQTLGTQQSGFRGIPLYSKYEIQSAKDKATFDRNVSQWIAASSTDIYGVGDSFFIPKLQSVQGDPSSDLHAAWQDICLNYGMLCRDLSELIKINRDAATSDALENESLPHSFAIRTELLRVTQSMVMRNRAVWDKIMNVAIEALGDQKAKGDWKGKGKSAKRGFIRAGGSVKDLIPDWFTKVIVGGVIELFDEMFRTAEIHNTGTLRKWALAQTIQVRTVDVVHSFFLVTELAMKNLQKSVDTGASLSSSRSEFFDCIAGLASRIDDHEYYAVKYREKFKAILDELADSADQQLQRSVYELSRAVKLNRFTDMSKGGWRSVLRQLDATLATYPDNSDLNQLRYSLLHARRSELSHLELIEFTKFRRHQGHRFVVEFREAKRHDVQVFRSADIESMDAAHLYDFALLQKDHGHLEDAVRSYRLLVQKYPNKHRALAGQSICLAQLNRLDEADQVIETYLEKCPGEINGFYIKGIILAQAGNHALAFEKVTNTLEMDSNWAAAWSLAGKISLNQTNFLNAITYFSKSIELAPGMAEAVVNRGYAYIKTNRPELAIADFRHAVTENPSDYEALYYLATCLHSVGPDQNRSEIVHYAARACMGGSLRENAKQLLMATLALKPCKPQCPSAVCSSNDFLLNDILQISNVLAQHRFYTDALILSSVVADNTDQFDQRLVNETTLLYWHFRNQYRGDGAQPTWVSPDKCDEAEAVFKALLKSVIGIKDPSFDRSLVANIWMQISQIHYSRAEHCVTIEAKRPHLTLALKAAVFGNAADETSNRTHYIQILKSELGEPERESTT